MISLEEWLASGGADLPEIVASVDRFVGVGPGDVLLGVGSLVEGLGTVKSDLDLLLIAGAGGGATVREEDSGWAVGRCLVDLRVVRRAAVEELLARLREWARRPWSVTVAASFTYDERVLLHRLLHGRQLFPDDHGRPPAALRPPRRDLARLKLQVARHLARTIQVDMVGYRDNGDYRSLVFAAQELLGHAVDGLLAGHQLTSPTPKWRSRLLDSLPPDWERSLPLRPTGLPAGRRVWELHRAPAEAEEGPAIGHAQRCVAFARGVFAWAEPRLVESSVLRHPLSVWIPGEPEPLDSPLPSLEIDVDFFLSDGRVAVARLNEFTAAIEVSEAEFALLLSFDGATAAREAAIAVCGAQGDAGLVDVARIVGRAVESGLCFRPREERMDR